MFFLSLSIIVSYDGIIKNKYLIFVPQSWSRAPRTLGVYFLLYADEMTHGCGGSVNSFRIGGVARETN